MIMMIQYTTLILPWIVSGIFMCAFAALFTYMFVDVFESEEHELAHVIAILAMLMVLGFFLFNPNSIYQPSTEVFARNLPDQGTDLNLLLAKVLAVALASVVNFGALALTTFAFIQIRLDFRRRSQSTNG
jgi:hypothetical protein